jgi:cation diffusion facilitator family transporter
MEDSLFKPSAEIEHEQRQKKAVFVVNLGLGFNALLATLKLGAGVFGHSQALIADGVNSVSDVVYYLVVKFFVKLSGKPADPEHPYGHYQYETIAALVVGAFVITTGLALFWDSINAVFDLVTGNTSAQAVKSFTLWAAIFTIVIKIILMVQARAIGRSTKNLAVVALAQDHRNDIFASSGAAVGIILSLFGISWADPVAGAAVACIVAKTGFSILRESADELMESIPGKELTAQFKEVLSENNDILGIEEIYAHRFGPYLVANITICIDGTLSVTEADRIATTVENKLLNRISFLRKVYVHCHPDGNGPIRAYS